MEHNSSKYSQNSESFYISIKSDRFVSPRLHSK